MAFLSCEALYDFISWIHPPTPWQFSSHPIPTFDAVSNLRGASSHFTWSKNAGSQRKTCSITMQILLKWIYLSLSHTYYIYIFFFSPQTGHWKAGVSYACRDCCWLLSPLQVRKDGHQSCSDARVTNQAQGSCWAANTRPQEICQAGFQHTHIRDFPGLTLELNIALGCLDG